MRRAGFPLVAFVLGLGIGSWITPLCEFITQAVLGHSPLDPKEIP